MGSIRWLLLQSEEAQKKRGESKNRPDQLKKKLQKTRRIICSNSQQRVHPSTIQRIQQPMDMAKIKSEHRELETLSTKRRRFENPRHNNGPKALIQHSKHKTTHAKPSQNMQEKSDKNTRELKIANKTPNPNSINWTIRTSKRIKETASQWNQKHLTTGQTKTYKCCAKTMHRFTRTKSLKIVWTEKINSRSPNRASIIKARLKNTRWSSEHLVITQRTSSMKHLLSKYKQGWALHWHLHREELNLHLPDALYSFNHKEPSIYESPKRKGESHRGGAFRRLSKQFKDYGWRARTYVRTKPYPFEPPDQAITYSEFLSCTRLGKQKIHCELLI